MFVNAANVGHKLKTVNAGHHDIGNDDVRTVGMQQVKRLHGVGAAPRVVARTPQTGTDDLIQADIVFHN